jgi:O-antigen/teichoic acid export membrane protein
LNISKVIRTQGFKNSAWSLFGSVVYPVFALLLTPFFLIELGTEQFGIWVLVNTTLQLISSFNFGLGDTIINFVSKDSLNANHKDLNKTISNSLFLTSVISIVVMIVGISLIYVNSDYNWLSISPAHNNLATNCLSVALFIFVIKFFDLIALSIFQGFSRYELSSKFSLLSRVLSLGANFICVLIGLDLLSIFISSGIVQLCCLLVEIIVVKKLYPFLSLRFSIDGNGLKRILNFGVWTWLQSVLVVVTVQIDKFIVAAYSGVEILSYYSLGAMLAYQMHSIFVSVSSWVFPAVAKKSEANEPLGPFFKNANALLLILGFGSVVCILLLERPIFTLWLGAETYSKSAVYIQLFLLFNLFLLPNIVPYFFLNGSGYVKQNTIAELIFKGLNILSMIIFYFLIGNTGLVWGLIISSAIATPIRIWLVQKLVLKRESEWFGCESILTSLGITLFFISENLLLKLPLGLLVIFLFYYIHLRGTSILGYAKEILRDVKTAT